MTDIKRDVVKVKEIHKYIVLIVLAIITFIIGVVLEPNFNNLMDGYLLSLQIWIKKEGY